MNALLRLKKDMPVAGAIPFKYLLYMAMLSNVTSYEDEEEDKTYAVFAGEQADLYDYFSDWTSDDDKKDEVLNALQELSDTGLIFFDEDDRVFLGELRGKKFFPFEQESSFYKAAEETLDDAIKGYGRSKSAKDKSRARFIREQVDKFLSKGIDRMTPGDFTELHGFLYEIYTGGEVYMIRNKTEYYQTNNMLKAYDRHSVFAILVEGTLHYGTYRKRGVPTLTNVACMKDDVFNSLVHSGGSKDYMRDMSSSIDEDSGF